MIQPINWHILIKPLDSKTYLPTEKGTYDEVGIVVRTWEQIDINNEYPKIGDKIWFDGWLASKYPTGKGDEVFWLVPFNDIKAIEHGD